MIFFQRFILFIIVIAVFSSCKKKENIQQHKNQYLVEQYKVKVQWTGYKTTDKVPVKGEFFKLSVKQKESQFTIKEALNNISFSIPVSSIFSGNKDRDIKLRNIFFGAMMNTIDIKGALQIASDSTGMASLNLNNIENKLPFLYKIQNDSVFLAATVNLLDWKAQPAIDALHKACFELHKGADGISKTWSEVKVEVVIPFKKL